MYVSKSMDMVMEVCKCVTGGECALAHYAGMILSIIALPPDLSIIEHNSKDWGIMTLTNASIKLQKYY